MAINTAVMSTNSYTTRRDSPVFATGLFSVVIDMTECEPSLSTSTLESVSICEGPSTTDEQGTLVITTDHGVTAQRVIFD
jgi:hypothetical protein